MMTSPGKCTCWASFDCAKIGVSSVSAMVRVVIWNTSGSLSFNGTCNELRPRYHDSSGREDVSETSNVSATVNAICK